MAPHARFHTVAAVGMATILSPTALWLLWRRSPDHATAATVAALIPIAYWSPFFAALFMPGASVDDSGRRQARLAGIPAPLLTAGAVALCAGLGWLLDRRQTG